MPKLIMFVTCQSILLDARSGNVSFVEVVETVNLPNVLFPGEAAARWAPLYIPLKAFCSFGWTGSQEEKGVPFSVSFQIRTPQGEVFVQPGDVPANLDPPPTAVIPQRSRMEWLFVQLPLTTPGSYSIEVVHGEEVLGTYPIFLVAYEMPPIEDEAQVREMPGEPADSLK